MNIKSGLNELASMVLHLVVPVVVILCVYNFIAAPFVVSGKSMENSLKDEELILVNRIGDLAKEDIVVLHPPTNASVFYVKRIIGLPGDMISFKQNNVYLNGKILDEPYTKCASAHEKISSMDTRPACNYALLEGKTFIVEQGMYFVMGDNRMNSSDSRTCFSVVCDLNGSYRFVPRENIIGKKFSSTVIPDEVGITLGKILKPLANFRH